MNIGMIGSGNVGGALGSRWAQGGHAVVFGTRNPNADDIRQLIAQSGPNARAGTAREAAQFGDVLVLATPWPATRAILEGLGDLTGKILIDATNPLLRDLSGLEYGNTTSGAEQVASWAPGAKVVKAFNTVGNNIMANSKFAAGRLALFYCGDDAAAKHAAHELATELGFDALDAGPLQQARLLEPFALLWISLAVKYGYGREIAFQFLRR